ncbi:MAG TPA: carboxypeptidase-like regulatory domain-containing protein, partial [Candidatus Eisenbacteria bacterium]|nr:carboxypeptidase-like regulatory domain-containing protein [Candidatus Eisenbacteria bacterium]
PLASPPAAQTPPVVAPETHETQVTLTPQAPPASDSDSWPLLCGAVVDEQGQPVAGAHVLLADLDLGARTDRRGRFCIAAPPGDRTLSVRALGFAMHREIVTLGPKGLEIQVKLTP